MSRHEIEEVWRPVLGYEGLYEVSNLERIRTWWLRSKSTERKLSIPRIRGVPPRGKSPYRQVTLTDFYGRKTRRPFHQLICESFHGPRPLGLEVLHRDDDGWNNKPENLFWGTHEENMRPVLERESGPKGWSIKYSEREIQKVRDLSNEGLSQKKIAKETGMSRSYVHSLVKHKCRREI